MQKKYRVQNTFYINISVKPQTNFWLWKIDILPSKDALFQAFLLFSLFLPALDVCSISPTVRTKL